LTWSIAGFHNAAAARLVPPSSGISSMSSDQQPRQSIDTLVGRAVADIERSLRELVDDVFRTADEDRQSAIERATSEAREAANREFAEALAASEARLAEARDMAARETDRRVEEALAEARAEMEETLHAAQEDATRRADEARESARREADRRVEEAIAEARAQADEALRAAESEAARRVDQARAEAEEASAAAVAMQVEAARTEAALAAEEAGVGFRSADAGEREAMLQSIEHLRDAVVALDGASSLKESLDRLAESVSELAPRSFLLVVRGNALRGWRVSGYGDAVPQPESIVLAIDASGPLREVVEKGEPREIHPESFGESADRSLAFASAARGLVGFAVPVSLGGRPVAVVYADDGGAAEREVPAGWPEVLEVLARHTSRCLEALTAAKSVAMLAQGAVGSRPGEGACAVHDQPTPTGHGLQSDAVSAAERYARLVVSEIKLYNEAAIRIARHKKDIRSRLRAEIDRARRMYEERIPASVPGRGDLFEQELLRVLADGKPELLGTPADEVA
jgi:hypothetical protein